MKLSTVLIASVAVCGPVTSAERPIPNAKIDFAEHQRAVFEAGRIRESRRVTEARFLELAAEPGSVILDARSESKFKLRHVKGAVNLPFTEFTVENLAKVIPAKDTRVLIYCNNNFEGDRVAFADKRAPAALNLSTFSNLIIYGYTNVYELGPLLDLGKTQIAFEALHVQQSDHLRLHERVRTRSFAGLGEDADRLRRRGGFSLRGASSKRSRI
jgi:phage shock protein E